MSGYLEGVAMLLDQRGIALFSPDGPSSVFLDYLPERVEHALSLTMYGGDQANLAPGMVIEPRVQVRARGDKQSPRWSREKCADVYRLLHGFRGELPNGSRLLNCYGQASAATSMGPDAAGRFEHVLNFQLWVCDSVPTSAEADHASA